MSGREIHDGDGPLWKVSYYYVPAGPNQSMKSYAMFWEEADAEAHAAEMLAEPARFSDVAITFPHTAGEDNAEFTKIADLTPDQRAELDRLLTGKGGH